MMSARRGVGAARLACLCALGLLVASEARAQTASVAAGPVEDDDPWPLAWVRRPLTLRGGMLQMTVMFSGMRPERTFIGDPTTGVAYEFHSYVNAGAGLALGLSDRVQLSAWLPRALCFDDQQPSGCSPWTRYFGTGIGLAYAAAPGPRNQAMLVAEISVAAQQPLQLRWYLGGSVKTLAVLDRLALVTSLSFQRNFDPPPNGLPNPLLAFVTEDVNLQVTRRLLIFATLVPWGSVGDLGQGIALEVRGGASFAFNRHVELWGAAGGFNVLDEPPWYRYVPGWFAAAHLTFWRY
jgi:hypothetical protein